MEMAVTVALGRLMTSYDDDYDDADGMLADGGAQ
jgi:hypothetical protein